MFALHLQWPRGGAREKNTMKLTFLTGVNTGVIFLGHLFWGGSNNANVG